VWMRKLYNKYDDITANDAILKNYDLLGAHWDVSSAMLVTHVKRPCDHSRAGALCCNYVLLHGHNSEPRRYRIVLSCSCIKQRDQCVSLTLTSVFPVGHHAGEVLFTKAR